MLGGPGEQREEPPLIGLSKSDLALLNVVDLRVEALQVGVVEVEARLWADLELTEEDEDRVHELRVVLDALGELKAAAREMRAWAASIGSCG